MGRVYFLFLLALIVSRCDNTPTTVKTILHTDTTHVQDTMLVIKDSLIATAFADSIPLGAFQGMDRENPGSSITILFTKDRKYHEQMKMSNGHVIKSEGTWARKDGRIWLSSNNSVALKFSLRKDSLYTIETNSRLLPDSNQLVLKKRNLAAESDNWKTQRAQGIDFVGTGSDPSWNLEIDSKKMILFKVAEWQKPIIVAIEKPHVTKDSTFYSVPVDNDKLMITLISQYTGDGLTDLLYDSKVTVRFKGNVYKGCGVNLEKTRGL